MKVFVGWLVVFVLFVGFATAFTTMFPGDDVVRSSSSAPPEQQELADRMRDAVETLVQDIGKRDNPGGMDGAATYLTTQLRRAGYDVREQDSGSPAVENLVCDRIGGKDKNEVVVVAAHYDSEPFTPGADANASGCAALVEVARAMSGVASDRTVRFVLLANGAGRYAGAETSGAHAFVQNAKKGADRIVAALVIDSIGHYESKGTQTYPFPLMLAYGDKADFLGFVGDFTSRDLVSTCVETTRKSGLIRAEGVVLPAFLPASCFSDHASFWDAGIPAVTATDTGSYRSKHWSNGFDTIDRLDYVGLARATLAIQQIVVKMAKKGLHE